MFFSINEATLCGKKMCKAYILFLFLTPIFKNFKILRLHYKDKLSLKIKDIFTTNEYGNPYNTREGKLLFKLQVNQLIMG